MPPVPSLPAPQLLAQWMDVPQLRTLPVAVIVIRGRLHITDPRYIYRIVQLAAATRKRQPHSWRVDSPETTVADPWPLHSREPPRTTLQLRLADIHSAPYVVLKPHTAPTENTPLVLDSGYRDCTFSSSR